MTRNNNNSGSSIWSTLRRLPSSVRWTKGRLAALAGLVAATTGVVLIVSAPASAHHPEITVSLSCAGKVSYVVSADVDDASRNNGDVRVYDDSQLTHQVGSGVFNSGNSWSFSGSYTVASSVTSVTLTPVAVGQWGNAQASYPTTGPSATATRSPSCPPSEMVTTPSVIPNDSGTVTGSNPTGTLKFELFPPSDSTCSGTPAYQQTVTMSNGTASTSNTSFAASTIGTWRWRLTYSGDSVNPTKTMACGVENFQIVGDTPPVVVTEIHKAAHTVVTSVTLGTSVHDKVVVSKRAGTPSSFPAPTGTVIFHRYSTSDCTGTSVDQSVLLAADGTAETNSFTAVADMSYKADYQGDSIYPARSGACEPLDVPIDKTLNYSGSMEGALKWSTGAWVNAGYHVHLSAANSSPVTVTVTGNILVPVHCGSASGALASGSPIKVPITTTYTIPANSTDWVPGSDVNIVWQNAVASPALCGTNASMYNSEGATFDVSVRASAHTGNLTFQWHYRIPAAKGKPNAKCSDTHDANYGKADVCGASWSTTKDP